MMNKGIGKFLIVILFVSGLLACAKPEVNGHWHVSRVEFPDIVYFTMDIEDTLASYGRYSFFGEEFGSHNLDKQEINLPGDCQSGWFRYKLIDNQLIMEGRALGGHFIGIRCDSNCCSPVDDYFRDIALHIDLPLITVKEQEHPIHKLRTYSFANIFVGRMPAEAASNSKDTIDMQLGGELASISGISAWVNRKESQEQPAWKNRIRFVIYADVSVSSPVIKKIISELERLNQYQIFFGYRDERKGQEKAPIKNIYYHYCNY